VITIAANSIGDKLSRVDAIKNDADGNGTTDDPPLAVYSYR